MQIKHFMSVWRAKQKEIAAKLPIQVNLTLVHAKSLYETKLISLQSLGCVDVAKEADIASLKSMCCLNKEMAVGEGDTASIQNMKGITLFGGVLRWDGKALDTFETCKVHTFEIDDKTHYGFKIEVEPFDESGYA
eukprot:853309_1